MFTRVVTVLEAIAGLLKKRLLPTALGTAELREVFAADVRAKAFFSARTTNMTYLQALRDRIGRVLQGGYESDLPQIRMELKAILEDLGYTPRRGFPGDAATGQPGDAAMGVPKAAAGSLQDLGSDRRLEFIVRTQERIAYGAGEKAAGLEPSRLRVAPAWELVRFESRRVPRGTPDEDGQVTSPGWAERWAEAGGPQWPDGRLVALKTDPVWAALGDDARFPDAMGLDHPPFWFGSGCGWREVLLSEWRRRVAAGAADGAAQAGLPAGGTPTPPSVRPQQILPAPVASIEGVDSDLLAAAEAGLNGEETGAKFRFRERLKRLQKQAIEDARRSYAEGRAA